MVSFSHAQLLQLPSNSNTVESKYLIMVVCVTAEVRLTPSLLFLLQPYDSLPTSQTCFFQLRLPPYSSQIVMAERLRYAINNCRSIDMDNYMLSRNVDNAEGSDTDY